MKFRERFTDSLYHYSVHVGIRNVFALYWRAFAYEVLRWPDGVRPKTWARWQRKSGQVVFLAGPIDYWWNENWQSEAHLAYIAHRGQINASLVEAGQTVIRPHEMIKGRWNEKCQWLNWIGILLCDVFIYMTPPGVPAYGTAAETRVARLLRKDVRHVPPGNLGVISDLTQRLDDPYADVHRKSYTRET